MKNSNRTSGDVAALHHVLLPLFVSQMLNTLCSAIVAVQSLQCNSCMVALSCIDHEVAILTDYFGME